MKEEVIGIILAGGKGRRFGSEKGGVILGGAPLIRWVEHAISPHCRKVVVVTVPGRQHPETNLEVWEDLHEEAGVLGGIATGLQKADTPWVLASGCDTPFLLPGVARLLFRHSGESDIIVPRTARGYEPLRALYGQGCLEEMLLKIEGGDLKVDHLFDRVRTTEVPEEEIREADPGLISLININSREDLEAAESILRAGKMTPPPGPRGPRPSG